MCIIKKRSQFFVTSLVFYYIDGFIVEGANESPTLLIGRIISTIVQHNVYKWNKWELKIIVIMYK